MALLLGWLRFGNIGSDAWQSWDPLCLLEAVSCTPERCPLQKHERCCHE